MFGSSSDGTNGYRDQLCVKPPYCNPIKGLSFLDSLIQQGFLITLGQVGAAIPPNVGATLGASEDINSNYVGGIIANPLNTNFPNNAKLISSIYTEQTTPFGYFRVNLQPATPPTGSIKIEVTGITNTGLTETASSSKFVSFLEF